MDFDSPAPTSQLEEAEELSGSLEGGNKEQKLMKSVLENDKEQIDDGKLINDSLNQGISSFTPDILFQQLVKNYSLARKIYGESLLRLATGYNPDYLKRNIGIPEFRKELQQRIQQQYEDLRHEGYVSKDGSFTDHGLQLASLVLYTEELDNLVSHGLLGEKINKKRAIYGAKEETRQFRKGDRYRDIALKRSVKKAIRRGHKTIGHEDLSAFERESKGKAHIVYAIDASGSMKGKKLEASKKAGIALAYKAIAEKDKVGLIVFGADVKESIEPTDDFMRLLKSITRTTASRETDLASTIRKSVELFPPENLTKHLILITDALPTKGDQPERETLEEVAKARSAGITVSLIGIKLDEKGQELGQGITTLGEGRFSVITDTDDADRIVLQDYYSAV